MPDTLLFSMVLVHSLKPLFSATTTNLEHRPTRNTRLLCRTKGAVSALCTQLFSAGPFLSMRGSRALVPHFSAGVAKLFSTPAVFPPHPPPWQCAACSLRSCSAAGPAAERGRRYARGNGEHHGAGICLRDGIVHRTQVRAPHRCPSARPTRCCCCCCKCCRCC